MVSVYEWVSYDSIWADLDSIWADSEPDFHTSRTQDTHPFALITHHHPPTSSSQRLSLINSMLEKKRHRRRWLKASNRWSVTFKIWSLDILLKYLVGAYCLPQQAQWFIALPSYISKSDLIADLENFIQTGVLCACCSMSDSRLLELELAQVASLALLAWFGLLLWKNLDKQTCSCLGMCASSVLSEPKQQQLLLFITFHSNIILQTVIAVLIKASR